MDIVVLKFAIYALRPNAKWHFGENDTIVWLDEEQSKPTDKEITDWIKATQYQRDRRLEYPSIDDCIHALLDGGETLTELQATRSAIKEKYPKPSE